MRPLLPPRSDKCLLIRCSLELNLAMFAMPRMRRGRHFETALCGAIIGPLYLGWGSTN
jgi:hypothetical protein